MSNQYFDFKRFRIEQENCSMKVGTDGVLLGAWFPLEAGMSVLDIGTGTGLAAIMAAQRGAGSVTAVEIDPDAAGQARRNAAGSPWTDRINVHCADIARFTAESGFDRIVCNPPYFRDSLRCPDAGRTTARHNDSLSFETLVRCSADMLAPDGVFCVVLPFDAVGEFSKCASVAGLNLCRRTDVITAPGKQPKRSLLAFSRQSCSLQSDVLIMCGSDGSETSDYINLVKDFYLKF
ncbi:MAG: methyltransferase [Bacteroidaceae bacterium]|nr:methyltransferase [Bacteroidaceae bacterium]